MCQVRLDGLRRKRGGQDALFSAPSACHERNMPPSCGFVRTGDENLEGIQGITRHRPICVPCSSMRILLRIATMMGRVCGISSLYPENRGEKKFVSLYFGRRRR